MKTKLTLVNSNAIWEEKRRYKVNTLVSHNSFDWQNATGINTEPGVDGNWVKVSGVGGTAQNLQQVLDNNHDLSFSRNYQGTDAGLDNTGENVNLFGNGAGFNNSGSGVNALGSAAAVDNTGNNVNAFGTDTATANTADNVNAFGNTTGQNNTFKNVNLFGAFATADGENQNVFSKWISGVTKILLRLSFDNITADRKQLYQDKDGTFAYMDDIPTTATQVGALSLSGDNANTNVNIGAFNFQVADIIASGSVSVASNIAASGNIQSESNIIADGTITSGGNLVLTVASTTADLPDSTDKRYQTDTQRTNNDATSPIQAQLDGKQGTLNYPHTIFTPTTGSTVNVVNKQYNIINPAGSLLALTINLPSSPANGDSVQIKYTQGISTVTYTGGTVVSPITTPVTGMFVILVFDNFTNSWY